VAAYRWVPGWREERRVRDIIREGKRAKQLREGQVI
jgi:hypothetical protein